MLAFNGAFMRDDIWREPNSEKIRRIFELGSSGLRRGELGSKHHPEDTIMITRKLYYEDTHLLDFTAKIISCEIEEHTGNRLLILDQTAFFPEEGGQKADAGTINDLPVLDVQIKDQILIHTLPPAETASIPLIPGDTVSGHVNWQRRFDFMQQHSGEHILSGLANSRYGCNNVGFHLNYEEVTMDFDKVLTWEQLRELEELANRVIQQNLSILTYFPDPSTLKFLDYRSKQGITGDVRIVEIPGVDKCACCAPHADSTGQIGLLKIVGMMHHRGGIRLNILCGMRAVTDYTKHQDYVSDVSVLLSAKPENMGASVRRLQTQCQQKQERINFLQAKLLAQKVDSLPSLESCKEQDIYFFEEKMDTKALRNAVNSMTERYSGYCGIFSGSDEEGYFYIIGSVCKDCTTMSALLRDTLKAKGGGSSRMIQGTILAPQTAIQQIIK